jgi:aminoglycoside/choline kinase family phosphotransferase
MNRNQALIAWAQSSTNDQDCYIKPASSDASFRSYWRIFTKSKTYILMDAPPEFENCLPFIKISKVLNSININAPKVLNQDLESGFLLLEDLGTQQYLSCLNQDTVETLYKDAIESIHNIQQNALSSDLPIYNQELLNNELNLFNDWFIQKHIGYQLSENDQITLNNAFKILIDNALEQPQAFVHRDYHSRNLMKTTESNPGVLDFQDAVLGPVTYDLVSLLRDCYITWSETLVLDFSNKFREKYNELNQTQISAPQWQKWFDLMGMQRHLKAIGIFCRLNYRDKKPNYLKDINRTMQYVISIGNKYNELSDFNSLINNINPCMEKLCKP